MKKNLKRKRERHGFKDLFLKLPDDLIHRILHFLPTIDAAQTSVLSKRWKRLWDLRAVLDLNEAYFPSTKSFANFLSKTLERYRDQRVSLEKFRLKVYTCDDDAGLDDLIKQWMDFAVNSSQLEVLNLYSFKGINEYLHSFSSKKLTTLMLSGFKLKSRGDDIAFPCLRNLAIEYMKLDDALVQKLISGSPLLERLGLIGCEGLTALEASNVVKLKNVTCCTQLARVKLRAPSLESFNYDGSPEGITCEMIKLEGCEETLKRLHIEGAKVSSSEWFQNQIISRFPFLEVLVLVSVGGLRTVKLLSKKLTKLALKDCEELDTVTIFDAPKLDEVIFTDNKWPFYSLPSSSSLSKAEFSFCLHRVDDHNQTIWFDKLVELFRLVNHMKDVVVTLQCMNPGILIVQEEIQSDSLLPILNDLDYLDVNFTIFTPTTKENYLEELLLVAPWKNVYVVSSSSSGDFSKFLIADKLHNFVRNTSSCEDDPSKCPTHNLASFKIGKLENWDETDEDSSTKRILSEAYKGSSLFSLTRFCFEWKLPKAHKPDYYNPPFNFPVRNKWSRGSLFNLNE